MSSVSHFPAVCLWGLALSGINKKVKFVLVTLPPSPPSLYPPLLRPPLHLFFRWLLALRQNVYVLSPLWDRASRMFQGDNLAMW